uniref:EF-hand domain-containing protein n=1 Tax=Aureoumbra lagunensis TaxID=44058 RepID=A0A7S3JPQ8_9STRA
MLCRFQQILAFGGKRLRRHQSLSTRCGGPLIAYERLVTDGLIQRDPVQLSVMARFERLYDELRFDDKAQEPKGEESTLASLKRFFGGTDTADTIKVPRGLYVHGSTGSGKTFCMDLFYEQVEQSKQRIHFHEFMLSIHRRLHELKNMNATENPLTAVAHQVLSQGRLLCLDEMQVTDIADALIIKNVFQALFEAGCIVVATSNRPPSELYYNGLQRQLFEPFIPLLEKYCQVVSLENEFMTDYRLVKGAGETARVYFIESCDHARDEFLDCKERLLADPELSDRLVLRTRDSGREVHVPRADLACRAGYFTFDQLCGSALGAADYLAIAQALHVVFVDGVPIMDLNDLDRARRFITLLDALYDNDCVVVIYAATEPEFLFVADKKNNTFSEKARDDKTKKARDEAFAFDRAVSRLAEMGSVEYLTHARENRPPLAIDILKAPDLDVDQLFQSLDVDNSGNLDTDELAALLADVSELRRGHRNVPDEEVQIAMTLLDTNGDGFVDLEELRHYVLNSPKGKDALFRDAIPQNHDR